MIAFTPDRGDKPVGDEQEVRAEFEVFDTYFMLKHAEGASLLATGEGFGPFALEWYPAVLNGKHLKVSEELKRSEVLAVMLAYFRGDPDWRGTYEWDEADDPKPGWFGSLVGRWFSARRAASGGA